MQPEIVTVGVYGWDEDRFFRALVEAGVEVLCDLRARRGVRGSQYAFANSQRLQTRLAELGIRYVHQKDLAPTPASRQQQQAADQDARVAKRQRVALSPDFTGTYQRDRLVGFDSAAFISSLGAEAQIIALFCVEREPAACHRSLLAEYLAQDLEIKVKHLVP